MVESNQALVGHIVARMASRLPASQSRDDLMQTGLLGLVEAACRFDPEYGVTFGTFASRRIEGAIIDMLRRNDWAPRSVRALERQIALAESSLPPMPDRRKATVQELSERMALTPKEIHRHRADVSRASLESLDRSVGRGDATETLGELLPDESSSPADDYLDAQELRGYLRDALALLPERHRIVVLGFFFEGKSMTELGAVLGVTQSRASQIKEEAICLVREAINDQYREGEPEDRGRQRQRQQVFNEALRNASPWKHRLRPEPLLEWSA